MFTLKKLLALPKRTMIRKLVFILQKAEIEAANDCIDDPAALRALLEGVTAAVGSDTGELVLRFLGDRDDRNVRRHCNAIRHSILRSLGAEQADWDFIDPEKGTLDGDRRTVFETGVYLEDIRAPFNVGSIFRTADSFGFGHVYLSPQTPLPTNKKAERTARGTSRTVPWTIKTLDEIAAERNIFALETGGVPLPEFDFPESGIVLVGSEELGLSPEAVDLAREKGGCVSIPLSGTKRSLNVSVAFGVLAYAWYDHLHSGRNRTS
jgi:TrmH family RNA methyltransferase